MRFGFAILFLAFARGLVFADAPSPPPKGKPWVAAPGYHAKTPEAWRKAHEANLARARRGGIDVLFYGDSLTQGWNGAGKAVWDARFAPMGAANFGIGGDSTRQLLHRLERGEVEGLRPRVVVLMIGTNNLYRDFNAGSDNEIVKGIRAVVGQLRRRLPRSKVLLLGLLPRENTHFGQRIANINRALGEFDDGDALHFLDLTPVFQHAPGEIVREYYEPDTVHINAAGYAAWADAMGPLLDAMRKNPR